jgi:hypothetical protein
MYFLIINKKNKKIKKLFHQIFVKENSKKDFATVFYLIDLIKVNFFNNDKNTHKYIKEFMDDESFDAIKKINDLLKNKKKVDLNNKDVRKELPPHKCIEPINNANFCIFFLLKTSILLFKKKKEIFELDFHNYLKDIFIKILHQNIYNFKKKLRKYFSGELNQNVKLYDSLKNCYDNKLTGASAFNTILNFLKDKIPLIAGLEFDYYNSSYFIWKKNDLDNEEVKNELDNNINNKTEEFEINDYENIFNINYKEENEENDITKKELDKNENFVNIAIF